MKCYHRSILPRKALALGLVVFLVAVVVAVALNNLSPTSFLHVNSVKSSPLPEEPSGMFLLPPLDIHAIDTRLQLPPFLETIPQLRSEDEAVRSTVSCDLSLGPTCAFTNVCLRRTGNSLAGFWFNLLHSPDIAILSSIPAELQLAMSTGHAWDLFLNEEVFSSRAASLGRFTEEAVVGGLYTVNDWGLHLVDTWFPLFRLRGYYQRMFGGVPTLYLARKCSEYNFGLVDLCGNHQVELIEDCQRLLSRGLDLSEFRNVSYLEHETCFKRVVLGAAELLRLEQRPTILPEFASFVSHMPQVEIDSPVSELKSILIAYSDVSFPEDDCLRLSTSLSRVPGIQQASVVELERFNDTDLAILFRRTDVLVVLGGGKAMSALTSLRPGAVAFVVGEGSLYLLACGYVRVHKISFDRSCGGFPVEYMGRVLHQDTHSSCMFPNLKVQVVCRDGRWKEEEILQQKRASPHLI